jgi:hypothetical protein
VSFPAFSREASVTTVLERPAPKRRLGTECLPMHTRSSRIPLMPHIASPDGATRGSVHAERGARPDYDAIEPGLEDTRAAPSG